MPMPSAASGAKSAGMRLKTISLARTNSARLILYATTGPVMTSDVPHWPKRVSTDLMKPSAIARIRGRSDVKPGVAEANHYLFDGNRSLQTTVMKSENLVTALSMGSNYVARAPATGSRRRRRRLSAERVRRLMHYGQILQSHALHFFHLSSPDLLFGFDPLKLALRGSLSVRDWVPF